MAELSETARAFRAGMTGLVEEHTAGVRAVERGWRETAEAADKRAQEQVDNARKLVARVQQRADALAAKQDAVSEIAYQEEDPEDLDPEVEQLSRELLAARQAAKASAAPEEPAPQPEPATSRSEWQGSAGVLDEQAPARPAPAPAASPRPRRGRPQFDDFEDEEYENQSWLR